MPDGPLISIVEDDQYVRESMRRLMRSRGYVVETFPLAVDFLSSPCVDRTACLIADINMAAMTGIELYQRLNKSGRPIPTILITAFPDHAARAQALQEGVVCYLSKPFNNDELLLCVRRALERSGRVGETSR